jgi:phage-related protein
MRYFKTLFLKEASDFLQNLDTRTIRKIIYNIDLAQQTKDPRLFKKIHAEIWEFRTNHLGQQIRLLAFWDKSQDSTTLVIATHGFIKKTDKVSQQEIDRALKIRIKYYNDKKV